MVCKELHKDSEREADRSEHHHCSTYSTAQHYWRRVRKISAEKFHVQLNAVAHDTYSTMHRYLRVPTIKNLCTSLTRSPTSQQATPKATSSRLSLGTARGSKGFGGLAVSQLPLSRP